MGNNFFNRVQRGKETVHGTAVPATKITLGKIANVKTDRKPVVPEENIGTRARGVRAVVHQYLYNNTISYEHATFQEMPWLFGCSLKGGVTPTEQTPSQGDMLWNQTPSLLRGASNNPDSSTLELGDDVQDYRSEYVMFERIRISGQVSQGMEPSPVNVEADFFGRQLANITATAGLSTPAAEPMNAKLARLYVDSSWASIGNKYFNGHGEGLITFTAQFTLESTSAARALMTAQQSDPPTFQAVRLQINGGQIGTGLNHYLRLDLGGVWEAVDPISGEDRSDNLLTANLIDYEDLTGAKLLQVQTVTNVNSY